MKKRTAFIGALVSLISLGQPLLIKTGVTFSTVGVSLFISEKANAEFRDVSSYFRRSDKRVEEGDYEGAISIIEKVIIRFPKFANSYYQRGYINAVYLEKYEEALSDLNKAIRLHRRPKGNLPIYLWMRAYTKNAMNDIKGACADWEEAKRLGDKDVINDLNQYCK